MALEPAPSATGQVYDNFEKDATGTRVEDQGTPTAPPIDTDVPQRLVPGMGDCLYVSIHRMYWQWRFHYPQAWAVMSARLQAYATSKGLGVPDETPLPRKESTQTRPEAAEVLKWRALIAAYIGDHFERLAGVQYQSNNAYDPVPVQRQDFGHVMEWIYKPLRKHSRQDVPQVRNAERALKAAGQWDDRFAAAAAAGKLWDASTQHLNVGDHIKDHAVTITKIPGLWAFGFERDVVAEILGIAIDNWEYAQLPSWKYARNMRTHGPAPNRRLDIAALYQSGGYIPRFNLIQNSVHFTYQAVGRKRGNDRTNVGELQRYVEGPADAVATAGLPTGGQLEGDATAESPGRLAEAADAAAAAAAHAAQQHGDGDTAAARAAAAAALKARKERMAREAAQKAAAEKARREAEKAARLAARLAANPPPAGGALPGPSGGGGGGGGGGAPPAGPPGVDNNNNAPRAQGIDNNNMPGDNDDGNDNDGGGDGGGGGGGGNKIRLRAFAAREYFLDEDVLSADQIRWIGWQMRDAHELFIVHKSTRVGYGSIMLMVGDDNERPIGAKAVTAGEASGAARVTSKEDLRAMMVLFPDLTTTLRAANLADIDKKNEHIKKYNLALRTGDEAATARESKNKVYYQELDIGFRMSMALILKYEIFREHGGWIALFAWFDQQLEELSEANPGVEDRDLFERLVNRGIALIRRISPKNGGKNNLRDKPRAFWKGLWRFLVRQKDLGTWDDDPRAAVANVATWEDMGWTPSDEQE